MNDTSPEAAEVQQRIFRAMTPGQRLIIACEWTQALRELILGQLRAENPGASEARLKRLLHDRWLGPELAAKAYGPLEAAE